ncbi:DsrE family protein [Magnetococcus marinus MC-1]|uniref:DsrE family protein n=1 Tax=Magnetococcus marinus (strain ATCC BAA-1437 / JCM 17883 / MC-1) TaxID=156889 RepID=A0L8C1_MAGMM|nr:DsrE family protein [Magnetococcus marinus]ABK44214.1 DsrE family protein [Magnetococcus marinus MC-1]
MSDDIKKIMFTVRNAPHGTIYVYEGLEVKLIMAAYDADISVVFMDDGVFALRAGQDTKELGIKGFEATYGVMVDYEIEKVFVDRKSMEDRGMTEDDLLIIGEDEDTEEPIRPKVVDSEEIARMMAEQHNILPY